MSGTIETSAEKVAAFCRENGLLYGIGFLAVLGMKHYYSHADAGDLLWILEPVACLVRIVTGMPFTWDPAAGFVNHSQEIVIAPACAGVNFLIICFGSLFFFPVSRLKRSGGKWGWLVFSACASYLMTLLANTVRILLSMELFNASIYGGPITPGRVHELAGIIIYVGILVAVFPLAERLVRRGDSHQFAVRHAAVPSGSERGRGVHCTLPVPLVCYGLVTVVVPLANGAAVRGGARFAEHAVLVCAVSLFTVMIMHSITAIRKKRVDMADKTKEKNDRDHCL